MLPAADDHPSNPNFAGPLHDLAQQRVGALPVFERHQIIRLVEVYRADIHRIDEVENIDRLRRLDVGFEEIVIGQRNVFAFFVFVALDDFVPGHLPAGFLIDSSISNASEIAPVEQIEIYRPIGFRRMKGDGNIDQPEINHALPNRAASRVRLGRCSSLLVRRFFTWHGFSQLLNGFLVDRGAGFVAAVLYLDRPAASGFCVARAASCTSSFVSSPLGHGSCYADLSHKEITSLIRENIQSRLENLPTLRGSASAPCSPASSSMSRDLNRS